MKELLNWSQIKVRKIRNNQADYTTLPGYIDKNWEGWTKWFTPARNSFKKGLIKLCKEYGLEHLKSRR